MKLISKPFAFKLMTLYELYLVGSWFGVIQSFFPLFNFPKVGVKMSAVANLQVEAERSRLVEAKRIAESEKRLYVRVC